MSHSGLKRGLVCAALVCVTADPVAAAPDEARRAAQAIEKMLQRHAADVHGCFAKALADRLDTSGKVEVEIEVGAAGLVKKTRVLSQGREVAPQLSSCVRERAAQWTVEGLEPGDSVVLPFVFQEQAHQFVIDLADVPERGPQAAGAKVKSGRTRSPPFTAKVLADELNVRAQRLSLTLLSVGPASRVAMHRHPRSDKILYLLEGHARILTPGKTTPAKMNAGSVAFIPAGFPHVIENMGRQATAVFLQAFAPPGPERVYRDPADPRGRADFEVIRDPRAAVPPPGATMVVRTEEGTEALSILGGKGKARILLDQATTGSPAIAVSLVEFSAGIAIPRHSHAGSAEALYVLTGSGTLEVGSEPVPFRAPSVIHIPADQPHGAKVAPGETARAIQIYAPAGPEQRFRAK